jgi:hypothetical protein
MRCSCERSFASPYRLRLERREELQGPVTLVLTKHSVKDFFHPADGVWPASGGRNLVRFGQWSRRKAKIFSPSFASFRAARDYEKGRRRSRVVTRPKGAAVAIFPSIRWHPVLRREGSSYYATSSEQRAASSAPGREHTSDEGNDVGGPFSAQ